MENKGKLTRMGPRTERRSELEGCYLFFHTFLGNPRGGGLFWLAPTLGNKFLFHLSAPSIVHITGKNNDGMPKQGTESLWMHNTTSLRAVMLSVT